MSHLFWYVKYSVYFHFVVKIRESLLPGYEVKYDKRFALDVLYIQLGPVVEITLSIG